MKAVFMQGKLTALATAMLCAAASACFSTPVGVVDSGPGPEAAAPEAAPPDATLDATLDAEAGTAPPDATLDAEAGTAPDAVADAGVEAALACTQWDAAVELEAGAGGDGATSINAEGGAALPGPSPAACSLLGDTPAPLQIINNSPCPIEMWWVDYNCQEQSYGVVDPGGGTWSNDTWETNPWRIRLAGSEVLLLEIPAVAEGVDASLRTVSYP